jgi:hypothetical protein
VLIACEGMPAIFSIPCKTVTDTATLQVRTIMLPGNVLDVAAFDDNVVISIDNVHQPGSTKAVIENSVSSDMHNPLPLLKFNKESKPRLVSLNIFEDNPVPEPIACELTITTKLEMKTLQSLLYSAEILRKRRNEEDGQDNDED